MRLHRVVIIGLTVAALARTTSAADGKFGLGIIVGEPTGISMKAWTGEQTALAGAAAWSFEHNSALHLHLDMLWHRFDRIKVQHGKLPFYFGVGGRIKIFEDDTALGARIPVGLDYMFENEPIDVFIEVVPLMDLVPETRFTLNSGIGVRFFF